MLDRWLEELADLRIILYDIHTYLPPAFFVSRSLVVIMRILAMTRWLESRASQGIERR